MLAIYLPSGSLNEKDTGKIRYHIITFQVQGAITHTVEIALNTSTSKPVTIS
jgi:hypothetical protein